MDKHFIQTLFRPDRWKVRHEVLNVININFPPPDYDGNQENWIQDITTFAFLNPHDWTKLHKEYLTLVKKSFPHLNQCTQLDFFCTEEGEQRAVDEEDIYLRIRVHIEKENILSFADDIGTDRIIGFSLYYYYTKQGQEGREKIRKTLELELKKRQTYLLKKNRLKEKAELKLSFQKNFDTSLFQKQDIYLDILNHNYIIL